MTLAAPPSSARAADDGRKIYCHDLRNRTQLSPFLHHTLTTNSRRPNISTNCFRSTAASGDASRLPPRSFFDGVNFS